MGMQQLLLIVLSVIIVSVSVVGAVGLFNLRAKKANRAAIIQDMYNIAVLAISYTKTPANMGGGAGECGGGRAAQHLPAPQRPDLHGADRLGHPADRAGGTLRPTG